MLPKLKKYKLFKIFNVIGYFFNFGRICWIFYMSYYFILHKKFSVLELGVHKNSQKAYTLEIIFLI